MKEKINSFTDLKIWQKAKEITTTLHSACKDKKGDDYQREIMRQLFRTSLSISNNIAEGFERQGNKEFKQFLYIAKASNAEFQNQLIIAREMKVFSDKEFEDMNAMVIEVSKMILSLLKYLNESDMRGSKYVREEQEIYLPLDLSN